MAYWWSPIRNACTGHPGEPASTTAAGGGSRTASLCPTNASNVGGRDPNSGSARPAAVSVTGTVPIGSPWVWSTVPPWWTPRVPTP